MLHFRPYPCQPRYIRLSILMAVACFIRSVEERRWWRRLDHIRGKTIGAAAERGVKNGRNASRVSYLAIAIHLLPEIRGGRCNRQVVYWRSRSSSHRYRRSSSSRTVPAPDDRSAGWGLPKGRMRMRVIIGLALGSVWRARIDMDV